MKFGELLKEYADNKCQSPCIGFDDLRRELSHSSTFAQLLLSEIKKVDESYRCTYVNYLDVANRLLSPMSSSSYSPTQLSDQKDELASSIHNLYEYAVWNLIAIEKISKKHDKIHPVKLTPTVHAVVSRNTFLYRHMANSELYKLIPSLEQDDDSDPSSHTSTSSSTKFKICSVCLRGIKSSIELDCHHSFCLNCISEMASHFFSTCPTCRQAVPVSPVLSVSKKILGQSPNETFSLLCADRKTSTDLFASKLNAHSLKKVTVVDDDTISSTFPSSSSSSLTALFDSDEVDSVKALEHLGQLSGLVVNETLHDDFIDTIQLVEGYGSGVGETDRSKLIVWLRHLSEFFSLSPETYASTAAMLDRMLATTRVKPEHGDLAGMACLLIASKISEPEELQPTLRELRLNCGSAFSESDINRMADIVSRRVGACNSDVAAFDFAKDLIGLTAALNGPAVAATDLFHKLLTKRILASIAHYELLSFRPSTLALAMFKLQLQRMDGPTDASCSIANALCGCLQVERWDLDNCCARINVLMPFKQPHPSEQHGLCLDDCHVSQDTRTGNDGEETWSSCRFSLKQHDTPQAEIGLAY